MQEVIFGTDLHGDMRDKRTVGAFLSFCESRPKAIRIFGGDLWDFRAIRSGASKEQKRESMRKDFKAGMEFLEAMRPHVFLRGNHDERLWKLAATNQGPLADYAIECIERFDSCTERLGTRVLSYHKRTGIHKAGPVSLLHGYYHGDGAVRKHAQTYGTCVFGHIHACDQATIPGLKPVTAYSIGSLANNDFDYNSAVPSSLRHENGWAIISHWGRRGYMVQQVRRIGNSFAIPGEASLI